MINSNELKLLQTALGKLAEGVADLPEFAPQFDAEAAEAVLLTVAERMQDNYPYYHPQYAGQMLKPPHPVARLAYALSLWVNPNNHALDGGRASSALEKECIVELAEMVGWSDALGHLTGGGTMANLEGLWVAGRLHPGQRIVASAQAHYTHSRISDVLGLPFTAVEVDTLGRLSIDAIRAELAQGDVGTIVATLGNTGLGAVDPLPELLDLAAEAGVRVHVDAAYGGYFGLADTLGPAARAAYDRIGEADSIVIDPHKHGLQPYGCGCILFRDAAVGRFYKHGSPYTYFSSAELHLGEISLECSRPGAAAVALWATQQLYPLVAGGQFARSLDGCLASARSLYAGLIESPHYVPLLEPELDIVVYAPVAGSSAAISAATHAIFEAAAKQELHLAMITLPSDLVQQQIPDLEISSDSVTCLRSVMMKPEQRDWVDRILEILNGLASELRLS